MKLHTGLDYMNNLTIQELLDIVEDLNEMEKDDGK